LSRSSPDLLKLLFTLEVPEVADGVVRIMVLQENLDGDQKWQL